jgi:uncharacterized protein (TIGR04255 family)
MSKIVDFDRPPVVETVVGVQFERIATLRSAHLGNFWKSLGSNWPIVNDAPPLTAEFEHFGEVAKFAAGFQVQVQFSNDPSVRLMIKNQAMDRMIQLQNGRLHVNWLGSTGVPYPDYDLVRAEFDEVWEKFNDFVAREIEKVPKPNQWEVTYVNLIPRGTVWEIPAHFSKAFGFLADNISAPCGPLERISTDLHFEIAPQLGRLHVQFSHAAVEADGQEAVNLTLTARGPIGDGVSPISEGLDCGREAIVRAFKALTTEEARRTWGEKKCHS